MLRLKPKKIQLPSIEDDNIMEDYILLCDMKAVEKLQSEYKISIMKEMMKVRKNGVMDEEVLIKFFGAMVRKNMIDEPIGIEIFNELQLNPMAVVIKYAEDIVNCIVEAMPQGKGKKKAK